MDSAGNRTESRGAHAREDFPDRDDQEWMKHTLALIDPAKRTVRIDYRPVHTYTLTNDVHVHRAQGAGVLSADEGGRGMDMRFACGHLRLLGYRPCRPGAEARLGNPSGCAAYRDDWDNASDLMLLVRPGEISPIGRAPARCPIRASTDGR